MKSKNYILNLPQMRVAFSSRQITIQQLTNEVILIAGGRSPNVEWFKSLRQDRQIYCIDRGVDFCKDIGIVPEILIGDLDSADYDSIRWAVNNNIKIKRHPVDKDFTDTQLTLDKVDDDTFAIITGVFGGRFDHLYSNVFTCANAQIKNCLVDENEAILFLHSDYKINIELFKKPIALSLLPMTEICEGVTIDGVHWPLESADLKQTLPNAISNRVETNRINISIDEGVLAIYFCFND